MDKRTVAVLFGGCSSEYSVSLASAQAVVQHMDRERYTPVADRYFAQRGMAALHWPCGTYSGRYLERPALVRPCGRIARPR